MRLIDSLVEIVPQEPTLEGALKAVELAARVSHLSEDKITETSYKSFCEKLRSIGHMSPFEFGTIYLTIPIRTSFKWSFYKWNKHSMVVLDDDFAYVTTNLRVIYENHRESDLKYICEPSIYHKKRINTHWICSRAMQQEITRHRVFSFLWESTRWIGYDKDRYNAELQFIKPQWYSIHNEHITVALCRKRFEKSLQDAEDDYMFLREKGGSPQEARHVLPLSLKSEGYMCGFEDDWKKKKGFIDQRTGKDADPDIQWLAYQLSKAL